MKNDEKVITSADFEGLVSIMSDYCKFQCEHDKAIIERLDTIISLLKDSDHRTEHSVPETQNKLDDDVLSLPIEELGLSARAANALTRVGLKTVRELVSSSIVDLLRIRNFGRKSAEEVIGKLEECHLSLLSLDTSLATADKVTENDPTILLANLADPAYSRAEEIVARLASKGIKSVSDVLNTPFSELYKVWGFSKSSRYSCYGSWLELEAIMWKAGYELNTRGGVSGWKWIPIPPDNEFDDDEELSDDGDFLDDEELYSDDDLRLDFDDEGFVW